MIVRPELVQRVDEQCVRMFDALRGEGFNAELVCSPYGEALGVVSRNMLDPSTIAGSRAIDRAYRDEHHQDIADLRNTLPVSNQRVYPRAMLDAMDLTAQAAAERPDLLATNLNEPMPADYNARSKRGGGLGVHADYVDNFGYIEDGEPLLGLNQHFTQYGSCVVRLGVIRDFEHVEYLGLLEDAVTMANATPEELDQLFERLGAPFTEQFTLNAGDLLLFQAQAHYGRRLAATAHEFVTTSEMRWSDVFRPSLEDAFAVWAQRRQMAAEFALGSSGYALAA